MKEFTERLLSIPHELGHYKMMTGLDEEIRGYPEGPLLMGNRPQVLASEIIAFLEEQPLRSRYWEIEPWIISNRLGENLPLYVRMVNEHIYFRGVNERLMEGLMPLRSQGPSGP